MREFRYLPKRYMLPALGLLIAAILVPANWSVPNLHTGTSLAVASNSPNVSKQVELPKLSIPALGIEAQILNLGLNQQGEIDTPPRTEDSGWYNGSPWPGEAGTAIVTGHVSSRDGAPAIFAELHSLKAGDEIRITDQAGVERRFKVSSMQDYDINSAPLAEIYGINQTGKHLHLITCAGDWDQHKQTYSKRLVMKSKLIE